MLSPKAFFTVPHTFRHNSTLPPLILRGGEEGLNIRIIYFTNKIMGMIKTMRLHAMVVNNISNVIEYITQINKNYEVRNERYEK